MSGGGKGPKRQVYDFLASMGYGICHGPIDAVNAIVVKDKIAWSARATSNQTVVIDNKDLFGGDDAEGGLVGAADIYLGGDDQLMSGQQAARFERTPNDNSGWRGLAHVFFRGEKTVADLSFSALNSITTVLSKGFGFKWTSNNPYLPSTHIHVTRLPIGTSGIGESIPATKGVQNGALVSATTADYFDADGEIQLDMLPDANPAAMLYETMLNDRWGRGESPSLMNAASYGAVADTLLAEKFGLSMNFMDQDTIENFTREILDHIRGVQYQDPITGLWNLRLIRDDYDASDEAVLDLGPDNCDLDFLKKRTWGDVINQIRVVYTDPISEEKESVTAENPAVIAMQGEVVSETREYYGVRNPYLAKVIADRDVAEASQLNTTMRLKVNREGFQLVPGDVARFTWPDEGIVDMLIRINSVDWGSSTERQIVIDASEDLYGKTVYALGETQEPEAQPPSDAPTDLDICMIMGTPLPILTTNGFTVEELDLAVPQTGVMLLGNDDDLAIINIQADSEITQANGSTAQGDVALFPPTRTSIIGVPLLEEATSVLPAGLIEGVLREEGTEGDIFIVGSDSNTHELIMLDTFDGVAGEWTVLRGIWDTVPRAWADTERIWALPTTLANSDSREIFTGDVTEYRLRPRTAAGRLAFSSATPKPYTVGERPNAPFRPADVQIDGNGFGDAQYLGGVVPATIPVTWANRNRTAEDSVAARWGDGTVTPEVGQTTTIRLRDPDSGLVEFEYTGLTGTSHNLDPNDFTNYRFYSVEFVAVRDGVESFQYASRNLEIERLGYSNNYGYDYGENDGV